MPRQPRLDAPGVLHHVMARGIEQRKIFRDDRDRKDFVARLTGLAEKGAWIVYAWSLMPNHFHLLVRTGKHTLSENMRALSAIRAGKPSGSIGNMWQRAWHRAAGLSLQAEVCCAVMEAGGG